MQNCTTILGIIDMRQRDISYDDCRSRYHIGCSTISLIMSRFHACGKDLDTLKQMSAEEVEYLINETYQEMAEHYGTAIIPARVRTPKDKPNAEGTVGNISTWITAALRNEQFFSLAELNCAIREKLEQWLKHATDVLISYLKWIQFWKEFYKPEPDEEWHELFTEALANERKINDYLDVLMFGTGEEIVEFFKIKRREVEKIEERINEYQREVLDGIRRYCERGDAYNRRCQ